MNMHELQDQGLCGKRTGFKYHVFMTDAKQGDDDQTKIRSSSLRTQRLPVCLLRLVPVFGLVVLEMPVPLLWAGPLALNRLPHLCVA
jgi:hypothetical protein